MMKKSYFKKCDDCGATIHLRQMRHEQWVAFDGKKRVHKCGRKSRYDNVGSVSADTKVVLDKLSNNGIKSDSIKTKGLFNGFPPWFAWALIAVLIVIAVKL
jgi:hypothetical protein